MAPEETRQTIKESAKSLFFKFGIKRVSVEEISGNAGISKVTFYKYYKSKMELAEELRDELMEEGFSAFDEINKLDIPFMEKIDRMTKWQMLFYSKMNNEFVKEIVDLEIVEKEYKKRFIANLESGREKGEIRPDINFELVYKISRKVQEISKEGSWKEIFQDYGEYVKQARTIIFHGLLSRENNKME